MGDGRKENMSIFDDKEEVSTIKLGETEFTQEELNELVGAGRKLKELEEKNGQPVEDILSSWGRRGEEIGKYKKELEEKEQRLAELSKPAATVEQLDEEKTREQVVAEAKKYGLLTKEEAQEMINGIVSEREAGRQILNQTKKVLRQAEKDGRPMVELDKLLEFMSDPNNPRDPQNAYDIMFKKEIKEWEQKQLSTLKNKGMSTLSAPSIKEPERKSISTKDALKEALSEHFSNFGN